MAANVTFAALLTVTGLITVTLAGYRKERKLPYLLVTHDVTAQSGLGRIVRASLVADMEEFVIDVGVAHAIPVVGNGDRLLRFVPGDIDLGGVRIPRICHGLREDGRSARVEIQPEVLQDIQADRHFVLAGSLCVHGVRRPLLSSCHRRTVSEDGAIGFYVFDSFLHGRRPRACGGEQSRRSGPRSESRFVRKGEGLRTWHSYPCSQQG